MGITQQQKQSAQRTAFIHSEEGHGIDLQSGDV